MKKSAWAIVIDGEGHILLCRRSETCKNPGLYNFPGGTVDKGENPKKSARRELKEEAGLNLKLKPIGSIKDKKADKQSYFSYIKLGYRPTLKPNSEVDHVVWVKPEDMKSYPLHPPTFNFYKKHLKDGNVNFIEKDIQDG